MNRHRNRFFWKYNLEMCNFHLCLVSAVIIQSLKDTPPLTDDSVIFTSDRLAVGKVCVSLYLWPGVFNVLSVFLRANVLLMRSGVRGVRSGLQSAVHSALQLWGADQKQRADRGTDSVLHTFHQRIRKIHPHSTAPSVSACCSLKFRLLEVLCSCCGAVRTYRVLT